MKKFITIALVLVMALSLAAPALAYTNNVAPTQGVSPYTVDIYLVDYTGGDILTSLISMPATNRGYAKNEVIAAIGALTVPSDKVVYDDAYRSLRFIPKNVNTGVMDNKPQNFVGTTPNNFLLTTTLPTSAGLATQWAYNSVNDRVTNAITASTSFPIVSSAKTYRWLIFGKVTDDDATMKFSLSRGASLATANYASLTSTPSNASTTAAFNANLTRSMMLNEDYIVLSNDGPVYVYAVFTNPGGQMAMPAVATLGDLVFSMETTNNAGKTGRLLIYPDGIGGVWYRVHIEPSTKEIMFVIAGSGGASYPTGKLPNDQIKFGTSGYNALRSFYDDNVEALGFSAYNEGNVLKNDDWNDIAAAAWDVVDIVDIEPWTPYVVVPDNIVTDPPKTGDAASIIGFVMIALAGLAVVVVRKVRA